MGLRVFIVDDHKIMREGIRNLLEESGEFTVVGEAGEISSAINSCETLQPDLLILDLFLADGNGLDAIPRLQNICPQTSIVVLSMHDDESSVASALHLGARGFILKKASSSDLRAALRAVSTGGVYLSPEVSDQMLSRMSGRRNARPKPRASGLDSLSPREIEVLKLIAEGKTSKEIAIDLNLQVETVRTYRKSLMRKIGINHVAGLTRLAISSGLTKNRGAMAEVVASRDRG
jgi:DNA-binding NarL/FixJ family response regulator